MSGSKVSRAVAVKKYLEHNAEPIPPSEMMAFWKACSDEEKASFSVYAAQQIGLEIE